MSEKAFRTVPLGFFMWPRVWAYDGLVVLDALWWSFGLRWRPRRKPPYTLQTTAKPRRGADVGGRNHA